MEPSQSPLPRWAQHPFDNPVANIILHSDNIDFCVHSVILSEASRTCSASSSPWPHWIDIAEDSQMLDGLLRLVTLDPELTDLAVVRRLWEAALKYQMKEASTALTTRVLRTFALAEPLRIWAIACRLRLEEEARYRTRSVTLHVTCNKLTNESYPAMNHHVNQRERRQSEPLRSLRHHLFAFDNICL
ncbi:hypothetical protein BKA93DRAFT_865217 [Sparassis latifolia]